jgi:hypothetical protein
VSQRIAHVGFLARNLLRAQDNATPLQKHPHSIVWDRLEGIFGRLLAAKTQRLITNY